jgi:tripartite-type tricarboxylate transporter receptor subunit TctC
MPGACPRATRLLTFAVLLAIPVVPAAVAEDDAAHFPARSIRIVVPFPPGGPADIIARLIAQRMSEHWWTSVVVENRPGANTAIGAQAVAKSAPDGHTLLAGMDTTLVTNPLLTGSLPYEVADFAPITLLAKNMSLLVVRSDGPATVAELIAKAKASPGKLNMGAGTITSRLGALAFVQGVGMEVALIPYKGSAEIVQGLLAGSVDFAFDSTASSLPQIKGGSFRALAKYSPRPLPALPDLPSLADAANLSSLRESSTWIGLLAPAATPSTVVDKIAREVADIYGEPAIMQRLDAAGLFPVVSTPAEFRAFIRAETERWSKIIKDNPNLRPE